MSSSRLDRKTSNLTLDAVTKIVKNPDKAIEAGLEGGNIDDFANTGVRIVQVIDYIDANGVDAQGQVTDRDNPDSFFDRFLYNENGDPHSGLTAGGWTLIFLSPIAFATGVARRIYQIRRKLYLDSPQYMQKRLKDVGIEKETEEVASHLDILQSNKIAALPQHEPHQEVTDRFKPHLFFRFMRWLDHHTIGFLAKKTWRLLSNLAFIYWLVCAPVIFAIGLTAATVTVTAAMPWILLTAVSVGLSFATWKLAHTLYAYSRLREGETLAERSKAKTEAERKKAYVLNHLKQRFFIQAEHADHMEKFREIFEKTDLKRATQFFAKRDEKRKLKKQAGLAIANGHGAGNRQATLKLVPDHEATKPTVDDVLNSPLGQHLLGSVYERRARLAVTALCEVISGAIMTLFIGWLFAVTGAVLAPKLAVMGVLTVIGGTTISTIASSIIGPFFGIKAIAHIHAEQLADKQKIYAFLSSPYHKLDESKGIYPSKLEKFEQLEQAVTQQKKDILELQKKFKEQGVPIDPFIAEYDLRTVNVYNDYYFEKQRHRPSKGTQAKKIANRLYAFLGGGQTGIYIVRTLFLGGICSALFVGTVVGALAGLAVAAIIIATVVGSLRIAQYQLERNREHRMQFAETIDVRISYLKKKKKELKLLKKILYYRQSQHQAHSSANHVQKIAPHQQNGDVKRESMSVVQENHQVPNGTIHSIPATQEPSTRGYKQYSIFAAGANRPEVNPQQPNVSLTVKG